MKVACEKILWYILPAIRSELVHKIVKDHDRSQHRAAQLLGLSDAAVSQYISKKRGKKRIDDPEVLDEISVSATRILEEGEGVVEEEICRICTLLRSKKGIDEMIGD